MPLRVPSPTGAHRSSTIAPTTSRAARVATSPAAVERQDTFGIGSFLRSASLRLEPDPAPAASDALSFLTGLAPLSAALRGLWDLSPATPRAEEPWPSDGKYVLTQLADAPEPVDATRVAEVVAAMLPVDQSRLDLEDLEVGVRLRGRLGEACQPLDARIEQQLHALRSLATLRGRLTLPGAHAVIDWLAQSAHASAQDDMAALLRLPRPEGELGGLCMHALDRGFAAAVLPRLGHVPMSAVRSALPRLVEAAQGDASRSEQLRNIGFYRMLSLRELKPKLELLALKEATRAGASPEDAERLVGLLVDDADDAQLSAALREMHKASSGHLDPRFAAVVRRSLPPDLAEVFLASCTNTDVSPAIACTCLRIAAGAPFDHELFEAAATSGLFERAGFSRFGVDVGRALHAEGDGAPESLVGCFTLRPTQTLDLVGQLGHDGMRAAFDALPARARAPFAPEEQVATWLRPLEELPTVCADVLAGRAELRGVDAGLCRSHPEVVLGAFLRAVKREASDRRFEDALSRTRDAVDDWRSHHRAAHPHDVPDAVREGCVAATAFALVLIGALGEEKGIRISRTGAGILAGVGDASFARDTPARASFLEALYRVVMHVKAMRDTAEGGWAVVSALETAATAPADVAALALQDVLRPLPRLPPMHDLDDTVASAVRVIATRARSPDVQREVQLLAQGPTRAIADGDGATRDYAQACTRIAHEALRETKRGEAPRTEDLAWLTELRIEHADARLLGRLLRVASTAIQCGPAASETLRTVFEDELLDDDAFEQILQRAARPTTRNPPCPLGGTDKPIEVGVLVHGKVYELANVRKHHAAHKDDEGGALLDGRPLPAELPLVNPMTGKPLGVGGAAGKVPLVVDDVVKGADGNGALLSNGKKAHFTLDDDGAFECPVLFDAPEHCVLASDFGVYGEDAWKQLMTTGGPRGGAPRSLYDNKTLLAEKAHRIPVGKKGVEALEAALLAGDEMDCKAPNRGEGWSDGLDEAAAQALLVEEVDRRG